MTVGTGKSTYDRATEGCESLSGHSAGCFRLYVQLPTAAAHEYHIDSVVDVSASSTAPSSRLQPSVAQKIRELVSGGELRQYYIRHLLRLLRTRSLLVLAYT